MSAKQNTTQTKEPLLTPKQKRLGLGTLALVLGVMADGFVVALMPHLGIAVATAWNIIVITVLAVMLLGKEETP